MSQRVTIGLVQMKSAASIAANLARAESRVRSLAKRGAQIIALPELFLTPYFCQTKDKKFFGLAEPVPGPSVRALQDIARRNKVVLTTSVFEKGERGKCYNTAVVIDTDGKLRGTYRKMHIPDDPENFYGEAYYFTPGNLGVRVFKTRFAKIATLICWDQWFPEGARVAAAKGAQIIFYPTAIGYQLKAKSGINEAEHEAWQVIQRAHAIANTVFVAACNRVGLEHRLRFWGTSFVADPYGRVLAQACTEKEEDVLVPCDLGVIDQMRKDWPFLAARKIGVGQAKSKGKS